MYYQLTKTIKINMKKISVLLLALNCANFTQAQDTKDGYVQMEGGMMYKIVKDVPGDIHPDYGDYVELHLKTMVEDSVIFNTRDAMEGKPAPVQLQQSPFKGDLMVAVRKMTAGDSAIVSIDVDSIIAAGAPVTPWMRPGLGQRLNYYVTLVSVKTEAQKKIDDEAQAVKQKKIDEQIIKDYLAKNKIKAQKTDEGLYYKIDREGTGPVPQPGEKVVVNYTGKLTDGSVFDSNVDPAFNHVQPFEFMLGQGMVIKGWDLGFAQLRKGTKATLYIPSGLAYGPNSPSPKIPANAVMIFDVELIDIVKQEAQQATPVMQKN